MNTNRCSGIIIFAAMIAVSTQKSYAQEHETKQLLRNAQREHFKTEMRPQKIEIKPLQHEVLKVSPFTKLPQKFDRIETLNSTPPETRVNLNISVTDQPNGNYDYSREHIKPIPDPRSKAQWIQYSSGSSKGFDADPVRAIQAIKARKRKEKVDRIKKAYGQE